MRSIFDNTRLQSQENIISLPLSLGSWSSRNNSRWNWTWEDQTDNDVIFAKTLGALFMYHWDFFCFFSFPGAQDASTFSLFCVVSYREQMVVVIIILMRLWWAPIQASCFLFLLVFASPFSILYGKGTGCLRLALFPEWCSFYCRHHHLCIQTCPYVSQIISSRETYHVIFLRALFFSHLSFIILHFRLQRKKKYVKHLRSSLSITRHDESQLSSQREMISYSVPRPIIMAHDASVT